LQSAKARFSEVFRRARADGPQVVTRGATDATVIIPVEQDEKLLAGRSSPFAWSNSCETLHSRGPI
jgi:prevent-host-death family protein